MNSNTTRLELVRADNFLDIINDVNADVVCSFISHNHYPIDRPSSMTMNTSAALLKLRQSRMEQKLYTSTGSYCWVVENNRVNVLVSVGKRCGAKAYNVNLSDLRNTLTQIAYDMRCSNYKTIVLPLISLSVARFQSEDLFDLLESIFEGMHVVIATHLNHAARRDGRAFREVKPNTLTQARRIISAQQSKLVTSNPLDNFINNPYGYHTA